MSTVDVQPLGSKAGAKVASISSSIQSKQQAADTLNKLPLQETSLDIWDKNYRLKTKDGENVDKSITDTIHRVARALS